MTGLPDRVAILVVGAGQAGLAAGRELRRFGVEARIVDAGDRVGDTWRNRWDSLRLFTPAAANGLPGTPMTGTAHHPTKDEAADFLQRYAQAQDLPVHPRCPVTRTEPHPDGGLVVRVGTASVRAGHVVAATGAHRRQHVPALSADLAPDLVQLGSVDYRGPDALPAGAVLVVGAANSGAEIAADLAGAGRAVTLAGRDVGRIPPLGSPVFRAMRRIRTTGGPGRWLARAATGAGGDPLGRTRPHDLARAGVRRAGRVLGAHDGVPVTADGPLTGFGTVVWCTGLRPDLSWLAPAVAVEPGGVPAHRAGAVLGAAGVHLLGQPYQRTMASHLLGGVGVDATALARRIARELR